MMIYTNTVFLLITGVCLGGNAVLSPGPVYGTVGGSVWFNTNISPTDKPLRHVKWTFNWTVDDKHIVTSTPSSIVLGHGYQDRVIVNKSTGSLQLLKLTLKDTGKYRVKIKKSDDDPEISDTTELKVIEDKPAAQAVDVPNHTNSTGCVTFAVLGGGIGVVVGFVIGSVIVCLCYEKCSNLNPCFKKREPDQTETTSDPREKIPLRHREP